MFLGIDILLRKSPNTCMLIVLKKKRCKETFTSFSFTNVFVSDSTDSYKTISTKINYAFIKYITILETLHINHVFFYQK